MTNKAHSAPTANRSVCIMSAEKVIFTHSLTDTAPNTNVRAGGRNGTSVRNGVLLMGLTIAPNQTALWHPTVRFFKPRLDIFHRKC